VFFSDTPNVTGDDLKAYMDRMREGSVTRAIIVYNGKVTTMGKTFMDHLNANEDMPYHMEVFRDKELMVNVTQHELVPEHSVLSMVRVHGQRCFQRVHVVVFGSDWLTLVCDGLAVYCSLLCRTCSSFSCQILVNDFVRSIAFVVR
jgi:hypothetical protein